MSSNQTTNISTSTKHARRRMGFYRPSISDKRPGITKAKSEGNINFNNTAGATSQSPPRSPSRDGASSSGNSQSPTHDGRRGGSPRTPPPAAAAAARPSSRKKKGLKVKGGTSRRDSIYFNPYSMDIILNMDNMAMKNSFSSLSSPTTTCTTILTSKETVSGATASDSPNRGYAFLQKIAQVFYEDYKQYDQPQQSSVCTNTHTTTLPSTGGTTSQANNKSTSRMDIVCMILDSVKMRGCRFLKEYDDSALADMKKNAEDMNDFSDARYYEVDDFASITAVEKMLSTLSSSS